nr:MAG TPA: Head Tail Connector Protein [Caudoviricetes sp.]
MYADRKYYETGYLLGRSPVIPEDIYPYWEKQAERVLNQYTLSRLVADFNLITDEVKDCTCELAELLYQADTVSQKVAEQGGGLLSSYSNDGESGTFDLSQSSYTEEGKSKKEREIIYKYLGNTGLLYRGMQL